MFTKGPSGASVKNLPANSRDRRDAGSIPGLGRSPGGGHSNTLPYFCLENPHEQRNLVPRIHGVTKSQTQLKRQSTPPPSPQGTSLFILESCRILYQMNPLRIKDVKYDSQC